MKRPSNKKFGLFFSVVFGVVAVYAYLKFKSEYAIFALFPVIFFVIAAFWMPQILSPLNRIWFNLGLLLGKIVSPLVLGLIFFVLITPTALVCRLLGRDELKLKKRDVDSYWIDRKPSGPSPDSFHNQF